MATHSVTTIANPNIAFIKYWGDQNRELRIPANGSISMNLEGLFTQTKVTFDESLENDLLFLNGEAVNGPKHKRVSQLLHRVRLLSGYNVYATVDSSNNFPMGAGIASSASAFAALSLAASTAAGLKLSERELSILARTGSGSACRSIPGGFVEWKAGKDDAESYAFSIAPPEHWDLTDCIAIISESHKTAGSTEGHALAGTSPLQEARVLDTPRRLDICRRAILDRDFSTLAEITELDSNMMHAVIMTSSPPLMYWEPTTMNVMQSVQNLRKEGVPVFYSIDAGSNVHILSETRYSTQVKEYIFQIPGVYDVLTAKPGGPTRLIGR
jgi:diphosphomevalonate decarboxylase